MVGKEAYAHPHTHKLDAQTPSPDTYETVPNSGTARRRNLRVMVRDMKDGAKAVGHTMTHLPQAASEIAGEHTHGFTCELHDLWCYKGQCKNQAQC